MAFFKDFPKLKSEGFEKTSEPTWGYNCVAWAAEEDTRWWWPGYDGLGNEAYWPPGAPRQENLKAFIKAFKTLGYANCPSADLEEGKTKIAIYSLDGKPTHAARQLPDGKWTHKLGANMDVSSTLAAFEGPLYGSVVRYMAKLVE